MMMLPCISHKSLPFLREYGKKNMVRRAFDPSWLDYESMDIVFCHVCKRGIQEKGVKVPAQMLPLHPVCFAIGRMLKLPSRGIKNPVATKIVCKHLPFDA